jgi:hypothetical protein
MKNELKEGEDYYYEEKDGIRYRIFTKEYHLKRGFCCKNQCRNCPWNFKKQK